MADKEDAKEPISTPAPIRGTGKTYISNDERTRTITGILDKLIEYNPEYKWDAHCTYADGDGVTILQILIFSKLGRSVNGKISYQVETGAVTEYYYKGMYDEKPESITDLLLDILSFEIIPNEIT